jgi:glycosyltransferase involved in cell wall biosynthesis
VSLPTVSVIMSVYNGAELAPAAVRCILDQSFADFELIAIDNGSFKDDTRAVLNRIVNETGDRRLRVVELDQNIGLAGALNHGIGLARGRYIARQDHDDLSAPTRLEKQVRFLDANPGCGLLGTRAEIWVGDEPTGRYHDHPLDNGTLQVDLLVNNPFVHSSVMLRRSALDEVGLYTMDPRRQPPEDFELWSRIARAFEVANLPERLLAYREMPASMSRDGANPFLEKLLLLCAENIAWWNGLERPDQSCRDAAALLHAAYEHVSLTADIAAICARVDGACAAIATKFGSADVDPRREQVLANLRHHFMHARKLPDWTKSLISLSRNLPVPAALKNWAKARLSR